MTRRRRICDGTVLTATNIIKSTTNAIRRRQRHALHSVRRMTTLRPGVIIFFFVFFRTQNERRNNNKWIAMSNVC